MKRPCSLLFLCLLVVGCNSAESSASTRQEIIEGMKKWITEADQDQDGRLDALEWRALMRRYFPDVSDTDRQKWGNRDFAFYDTNGDGFIEEGELTALSLEGFDCHDTDGDG